MNMHEFNEYAQISWRKSLFLPGSFCSLSFTLISGQLGYAPSDLIDLLSKPQIKAKNKFLLTNKNKPYARECITID